MACDSLLKANLLVNCDDERARGIDTLVYVGSRKQHLAAVTYNATNKKVVDALVLKADAKLFKYEGIGFSNNATVGFTANEFGNLLPHSLRLVIFANTPEADAEIDTLSQKKDLFAIVRQNGETGRFLIYGLKTGLSMSALSSDHNDENFKGAYVLDFTATGETKTPLTLIHKTTMVVDTEAYLETLAYTPPA